MHPAFKEFLIRDTDGYTPEQKQDFLRMLKFKPDQVLKIISENLIDWGTVFSLKTGTLMASYNHHEDAQELLEAYQKYFAAQLATIT